MIKKTYKHTFMEIKNVELFLRQEVLDIITEGLRVLLFLTVLHRLDKGSLLWDRHHHLGHRSHH